MNKYRTYFLAAGMLLLTGCSVEKYLPQGERIYKGAELHANLQPGVLSSESKIKKELATAERPRPNKFLLGFPYKVWFWYKIGKPKKEKGFKAWLRKKLGEPPVLMSRVNPKTNAEDMQSLLENDGFFHSTVQGDTINKKYYSKAIYTATVLPQYSIQQVLWVRDSSALMQMLDSLSRTRRSQLRPGRLYSLNAIQSERSRLDQRLKTKGYYYFNPDYIMAYADSTVGNNQVDLYLNLKASTPENARHAYTINRVLVFPNYSLLGKSGDTSLKGLVNYDGLLIRDTVHKYHWDIFKRNITYRPGQLYSSKEQNTSLNRLINLGTFRFVKSQFTIAKDTGNPYRLDAYYYLTPSKNKSLQAEIDGFTEESRYLGSQLSVNWRNKNAFRRANLLTVRAYGSFAVSFADSLKGDNNYTLGSDVSLTLPKYVVPFIKVKENNLYPPRTNFLGGYELFIKQRYYTQNIFRLQYEFSWKESSNRQHNFSPVSITYLNASHITDSFYAAAQLNPSLLLNVYSETILGTFYNYSFNTLNPRSKNLFYFTGGIDLSGNVAGLISHSRATRGSTLFGTPFAQYVKLDVELRYSRRLHRKTTLANHLQIGAGIPYDNSSILPFTKQYIIGGANSVRGFPVYALGPGSYLPTANDIKYFQMIGGDFKLVGNTELRFPIVGALSGAVFVDAGNIWTKDTISFGPKAQLTKNFYKEIAVASGVGVRFDLSILLIRLDLGIPLRKPYLPDGHRWVINQIALGDPAWRRSNLVFNLAIGYPF